jgi:hypothetical protein
VVQEESKDWLNRARGMRIVQALGVLLALLVSVSVIREFFQDTVPWLQKVFADLSQAYNPAVAAAALSGFFGGITLVLVIASAVLLRSTFARQRADADARWAELEAMQRRSDEVIARADRVVAQFYANRSEAARDEDGPDAPEMVENGESKT